MATDIIADGLLSVIIKLQKRSYKNIDSIIGQSYNMLSNLTDDLRLMLYNIEIDEFTLLDLRKHILDRVVLESSDLINTQLKRIKDAVEEDLIYLGDYYISSVYEDFNKVFINQSNVPPRSRFFYIEVPKNKTSQLLRDEYLMGHSVNTQWDILINSAVKEMSMNLALGLISNDNIDKMMKKSSGIEGVYKKMARNLGALIKTLGNFVLVRNLFELFVLNSDVVKGFRVLNILDEHTTGRCREYNRSEWFLSGRSLNKQTSLPGLPPWHYNCRTLIEPILFTKQEVMENMGVLDNKKYFRTRIHNVLEKNYELLDNIGGRSFYK